MKLDLSRNVLSFLNSTPNKFECEVQSAKMMREIIINYLLDFIEMIEPIIFGEIYEV